MISYLKIKKMTGFEFRGFLGNDVIYVKATVQIRIYNRMLFKIYYYLIIITTRLTI